jgi:hypothetical protein
MAKIKLFRFKKMIILFNRFRLVLMIFRAISPYSFISAFLKKKTKDIAAIGAKTNRFHNTYPIK